ncbi:hypothetical protein KJ359_009475 [Pestalotiopsis sp. 9143b]|nr:hypothetical protein KJ359_009475 [Pestalotiopsis sp. 9143b]
MDDWNNMFDVCRGYVVERVKSKSTKRDVLSSVASSLRTEDNIDAMVGESVAMVIAGSDTLACTLVYALYHLARAPKYQQQICHELQKNGINDLSSTNISKLQGLPFLNAVINESLRLHPPVPTGTPRVTGPKGLTIKGKYIPPGTTVFVPRYHIARSPEYFDTPDSFDPDRWLAKSGERLHDTRGFLPFGAGKYGCIGRELALRQCRVALVHLILKFQFRMAHGHDDNGVETEMRDEFTAFPGTLLVKVDLRG